MRLEIIVHLKQFYLLFLLLFTFSVKDEEYSFYFLLDQLSQKITINWTNCLPANIEKTTNEKK